jgi:hypothetical protein
VRGTRPGHAGRRAFRVRAEDRRCEGDDLSAEERDVGPVLPVPLLEIPQRGLVRLERCAVVIAEVERVRRDPVRGAVLVERLGEPRLHAGRGALRRRRQHHRGHARLERGLVARRHPECLEPRHEVGR